MLVAHNWNALDRCSSANSTTSAAARTVRRLYPRCVEVASAGAMQYYVRSMVSSDRRDASLVLYEPAVSSLHVVLNLALVGATGSWLGPKPGKWNGTDGFSISMSSCLGMY